MLEVCMLEVRTATAQVLRHAFLDIFVLPH
jgi:hypothetical protein